MKEKKFIATFMGTVCLIAVAVIGFRCYSQRYEVISNVEFGDRNKLKYYVDEWDIQSSNPNVSGWCLKPGEDINTVDFSVILWDEEAAVGYKIPTQMIIRQDVTEAINDGHNYNACGFQANIIGKKFDWSQKYILGFEYKNNGNLIYILTEHSIGG